MALCVAIMEFWVAFQDIYSRSFSLMHVAWVWQKHRSYCSLRWYSGSLVLFTPQLCIARIQRGPRWGLRNPILNSCFAYCRFWFLRPIFQLLWAYTIHMHSPNMVRPVNMVSNLGLVDSGFKTGGLSIVKVQQMEVGSNVAHDWGYRPRKMKEQQINDVHIIIV